MAEKTDNPLASALRYAWGYLKEISGENAYDHYLHAHTTTHPEQAPLSRGEFYRKRQDEKFADPGSRCP